MPRLDDFYSTRPDFRPAAPNMDVQEGSSRYIREQGLADPFEGRLQAFSSVGMPESFGRRVGEAYNAAPDFDPKAIPHYEAMREDTGRQFDFLTRPTSKGGLGVHVETTKEDPYATSQAMMEDLGRGRLKVFSTASTGGHPFFSDDENDQFRAVHDAFGHAGTGRSFDRHGEEAAYLSHSRMYSPRARPAMAAETRGQNSVFTWLNEGREFPEQKVAALPSELTNPYAGGGRILRAQGRRSATNLSTGQFRTA